MNKTDILKRLSNKDIKIIKESKNNNYVNFPRLGKNGQMLPSQWRSWQVLQKFNIGMIKGDSESGELIITEFGKELAEEI